MRKYLIVFALLAFWATGIAMPPGSANDKPWRPGVSVNNPPTPCEEPPID